MTTSSLQILITCSTYEVLTNSFFALDSSEVRPSFLIKIGAFKAEYMEDAFFATFGK